MNVRKLMPLGLLLLAALPVSAGSDKGEKKVVVETVDVQVTEDGKQLEKKVVIVRRSMLEGADTNGDGMISKPEFLAHAEKHFAEMDRDKSGQLSKDEAMPQMPADMHKHMDGHHGHHGH